MPANRFAGMRYRRKNEILYRMKNPASKSAPSQAKSRKKRPAEMSISQNVIRDLLQILRHSSGALCNSSTEAHLHLQALPGVYQILLLLSLYDSAQPTCIKYLRLAAGFFQNLAKEGVHQESVPQNQPLFLSVHDRC